MKVLVTGAAGYIGQGVVKQLLDDGVDVVATDLDVTSVDDRASKIECDLFDVKDPFHFFGCPDVLLHLAWRDGFVHQASSHIEDLPKHHQFVSRITHGGVSRVAIMGTMHEIGFHEGSIDESTSCNPMTFYGIAKNALRESSKIVSSQQHVEWQWLRAYYIVSNSNRGNSIFSKLVKASESGQKEFPFTSGKNKYDFLDYYDLCKYIAHAVEQNNVLGIINICSGKPVSLAERVEQFIKDNHLSVSLKYGAFPDRPYDAKAVWGNNAKLIEIENRRDRVNTD